MNSEGFDELTPTVVCTTFSPGSVIANMNVFVENSDTSAIDQQNLITESVNTIAMSSPFFDSSSIEVNNKGKTFLRLSLCAAL